MQAELNSLAQRCGGPQNFCTPFSYFTRWEQYDSLNSTQCHLPDSHNDQATSTKTAQTMCGALSDIMQNLTATLSSAPALVHKVRKIVSGVTNGVGIWSAVA